MYINNTYAFQHSHTHTDYNTYIACISKPVITLLLSVAIENQGHGSKTMHHRSHLKILSSNRTKEATDCQVNQCISHKLTCITNLDVVAQITITDHYFKPQFLMPILQASA